MLFKFSFAFVIAFSLPAYFCVAQSKDPVLSADLLHTYVQRFNAEDKEDVINYVPNDQAADWMSKNVPYFECPDTVLQKTYYYRWWALRKHLKKTPDGYVFTEFITQMNHGGKYNTISSALGHHIYEGRWLRDPEYMKEYISFWLYADAKTTKPHLHAFSSWLQNAVYNNFLVTDDASYIKEILPALDADYRQWEAEKQLPGGMFWQYDVRDAMEESISGSRTKKNVRPTINSYMYANAKAMVKMAGMLHIDSLVTIYQPKEQWLRNFVQEQLWDDTASFFKVRYENGQLCDAREEIGFIPWYFNLPDDQPKYARQWDQLTDTSGFNAPWGITTAERRHPLFRTHGSGHSCEWDGAVWPYATTQTLKGLANLLTNYRNKGSMSPDIYYNELHKYAWSHQMNGRIYLGEYQDEKTGEWLKGDNPRSRYYNHSGFCDLIISDLIGLKPRADNIIEIHPLIPAGKWDWFCVDKVPYHGQLLTILWDKDGKKYNKGKGLRVFADGKQIGKSKQLKPVKFKNKTARQAG